MEKLARLVNNLKTAVPLKITLFYALLGGMWILFSDHMLAVMFGYDLKLLTRLQTYKGWFFVLTTASFLYLLIRNNFKALEVSRRQLVLSNHQLEAANEELMAAEEELRQQFDSLWELKEEFRRRYEAISSGIIVHEAGGKVIYANEASCRMLELTLAEMQALKPKDPNWRSIYEDGSLFHLNNFPNSICLRTGEAVHNVEIGLVTSNIKNPRWFLVSSQPIHDHQQSSIKEVVTTMIDITLQKQAEAAVSYQAYYDTLTGLPNKFLLNDRLNLAIAHAKENREKLAVMLLNIDRFRQVNDILGHQAGDQLLREIANRLAASASSDTTIAHMAGDEFVLVLPQASVATRLAAEAEKLLQVFQAPWPVAGGELHLTACLGIAVYPGDGADAQGLLKNAHTAMDRAKETSKNSYQFYTKAMHRQINWRLAMENELHQAIKEKQFVVYYQPMVNVVSGKISGLEALVRWEHPTRGLLAPDQFIPAAEEGGLIIPLGQQVLESACRQFKDWQNQGLPLSFISVNLSTRQFKQPDLVAAIHRVLRETALAPSCLVLEITESVAISEPEYTVATLYQLRQMGVKIAVDDFGTGYSSLSCLNMLPVDMLKIDRSFISGIDTNQKNNAIISAILAMSHSLALTVTAEGVETTAQLAYLSQLGCDNVQGYLFSKPVPASDISSLLFATL